MAARALALWALTVLLLAATVSGAPSCSGSDTRCQRCKTSATGAGIGAGSYYDFVVNKCYSCAAGASSGGYVAEGCFACAAGAKQKSGITTSTMQTLVTTCTDSCVPQVRLDFDYECGTILKNVDTTTEFNAGRDCLVDAKDGSPYFWGCSNCATTSNFASFTGSSPMTQCTTCVRAGQNPDDCGKCVDAGKQAITSGIKTASAGTTLVSTCISCFGYAPSWACLQCSTANTNTKINTCLSCLNAASSSNDWACTNCLNAGSNLAACSSCVASAAPNEAWKCTTKYGV